MPGLLLCECRWVVEEKEKKEVDCLERNHQVIAVSPLPGVPDDYPGDKWHDLRNDRGRVKETNGNVAVFTGHDFLRIISVGMALMEERMLRTCTAPKDISRNPEPAPNMTPPAII